MTNFKINDNTEYIDAGETLVKNDSQVAALVAAGHEDMAKRISYELNLIAQNAGEQLDKLALASMDEPLEDDYNGFFGFLRHKWDEATGENSRRELASRQAAGQYEELVFEIEKKREQLDPDYERTGFTHIGLAILYPHNRLSDLREQAQALPGMQAPSPRPSGPAPIGPV